MNDFIVFVITTWCYWSYIFLKIDVGLLGLSISEHVPVCALKTVRQSCCSFICPHFNCFFWCFELCNRLCVRRQEKQGNVVWQTQQREEEGFVAARNVCVNMVQGITSPGGCMDMLVEFKWNWSVWLKSPASIKISSGCVEAILQIFHTDSFMLFMLRHHAFSIVNHADHVLECPVLKFMLIVDVIIVIIMRIGCLITWCDVICRREVPFDLGQVNRWTRGRKGKQFSTTQSFFTQSTNILVLVCFAWLFIYGLSFNERADIKNTRMHVDLLTSLNRLFCHVTLMTSYSSCSAFF